MGCCGCRQHLRSRIAVPIDHDRVQSRFCIYIAVPGRRHRHATRTIVIIEHICRSFGRLEPVNLGSLDGQGPTKSKHSFAISFYSTKGEDQHHCQLLTLMDYLHRSRDSTTFVLTAFDGCSRSQVASIFIPRTLDSSHVRTGSLSVGDLICYTFITLICLQQRCGRRSTCTSPIFYNTCGVGRVASLLQGACDCSGPLSDRDNQYPFAFCMEDVVKSSCAI